MRRTLLWLACALPCACAVACGDDSKPESGVPAVNENALALPASEPDNDPPMPSAGTVLERANGLRISIETAGTGRTAKLGRTVVFHQRTRVLPALTEPVAAPGDASTAAAPTDAAPAEPAPEAAPESAPESAPAVAASDAPAAETSASPAAPVAAAADRKEPVEISSTWRSGVPLSAVLGRGQLIPGLEQALEGVRAGSRLSVHVPPALTGASTAADAPPASALEIELELVEVR